MKRIVRIKTYEMEYGPHFNEEHAKKAVSKMINEDGTKGPHWSIEETTDLAKQHNVHIGDHINKYDWYVALNMIYSDFYKFIVSTTGTNNSKHFVEMVKATYNDYKAKKEALAKYEEEMSKCEDILKKLDYVEEPKKENDTVIQDMQQQIKELKDVIKQLTNTEQKTDQQIQSEKVS